MTFFDKLNDQLLRITPILMSVIFGLSTAFFCASLCFPLGIPFIWPVIALIVAFSLFASTLIWTIWPTSPKYTYSLLDDLQSQDAATLKNFELDFFKLTPKKQYDLISKSLADRPNRLRDLFCQSENQRIIIKNILNQITPDDRFKMIMQPSNNTDSFYTLNIRLQPNQKDAIIVASHVLRCWHGSSDQDISYITALCKDFSADQKWIILSQYCIFDLLQSINHKIITLLLDGISTTNKLILLAQKPPGTLYSDRSFLLYVSLENSVFFQGPTFNKKESQIQCVKFIEGLLSGLTSEQLKPIFSTASLYDKTGFQILPRMDGLSCIANLLITLGFLEANPHFDFHFDLTHTSKKISPLQRIDWTPYTQPRVDALKPFITSDLARRIVLDYVMGKEHNLILRSEEDLHNMQKFPVNLKM